LHPFSNHHPLIIQELPYSGRVPIAFKEVMVDLSQEIPILDNTAVYTLLKNALVEAFTSLKGVVGHMLTDIVVDDVVE
jgi:hypothetical protein